MGVVTVSSTGPRSSFVLCVRFLTNHSSSIPRPCILTFKSDIRKNKAFITTADSMTIPVDEQVNKTQNRSNKQVKTVYVDQQASLPTAILDLDYDIVAANLETIYKLSPDIFLPHLENHKIDQILTGSKKKKKRLNLNKRIALKRVNGRMKSEDVCITNVDRLVRDYSVSTDVVSIDWKKMKIPAVLSSSEHTWLFKLMQPSKAILKVKENLRVDLARDPRDEDLADALNMSMSHLRKELAIGRAARNKLIKHNLRLVLFVIKKYYQSFATVSTFHDLCQAGVKGLILAIDRFEQKKGFCLSTYGLYWIRHTIIRSITVSSFIRVPFGIESIRQKVKKTKLELMIELDRVPKVAEIIDRVGFSSARYHDIMKASKKVLSLHSRHLVTQEEFIKGIADFDGMGIDKRMQPTLLRLAIDDVLDSLKPKESMVIRQRYGLDGKGNRTLGEIAGNLNISREMVRKHEVKALMKLKHPARVDYLRRHLA